MNFIKIPDTFT